MLFFLTLILSLTAIAADFIHFRRRRRRKRPVHRALVAWAAATDALPILSSIISALSRDNGTGLMHLYMWLFWAWIVTVPPRLAFYAFNFVNLRRTGYVAACAFVLFALWGTTRGRTSIRVNRVEICSDRIPEAFDGFRFVQITDMHVGTLVRPERELTRLADSVNAQRPEAVFFTGDLVNIRAGELDERTTALLRRIAGPVWSVTGNHDVGTYIKDSLRFPAAGEAREVVARQRAMGWTVLEDTTVYLRRGALQRLRYGHDLLHEGHAAAVGQTHARRAGDAQQGLLPMQLLVVDAAQQLLRLFQNVTIMALICRI